MKLLFACIAIALSTGVEILAAQTGNAEFCLQSAAGARCVYTTMAECERARGDTIGTQCITHTDARGATGLGEPQGR
jgi:hypothetical protein